MDNSINMNNYEKVKNDDVILRGVENNIDDLTNRENFHKGIDMLLKEFESDESTQKMFHGTAYGMIGSLVGATLTIGGGGGLGLMPNWSDTGRNVIAIVTNKRLFIVYANAVWKFLKIKSFKFDEIEYIKATKKKNQTAIFIKPINKLKGRNDVYDDRIGINVFDDKYLDIIDFIKRNNAGVNAVVEGESIRNKIIKRCLWGFFIACAAVLIIGCIYNWIINPVYK